MADSVDFKGTKRFLEALEAQPDLVLTKGEDLARRNTFRLGGPAGIFAQVASETALCALLGQAERLNAPVFLLGIGSNVLLPDEGLPGVVIKLGGVFERMDFDGEMVRAGGAASLSRLARSATRLGLLGLETLAGFPSTVGGAVRMNAGSYGTEICDVLREVRVVDRRGETSWIKTRNLGAGYRTTRLPDHRQIVVEALFRLRPGDPEVALARIAELNRKRWESLPSGDPNAGSIFRNPTSGAAGKLIDECGLKGLKVGGAQISSRHGNVIVNTGGARAVDVLDLMVRAHEAVAKRFSVSLEPEIVLAGSLRGQWADRTAAARRHVEKSIVDGSESR